MLDFHAFRSAVFEQKKDIKARLQRALFTLTTGKVVEVLRGEHE